MKMRATKGRRGLVSLGMWLLGTLVGVDAVWAQGGVSFTARPDVQVGRTPLSITVGDFNGDGWPDVATANQEDNTVSIRLGRGDGTFQVAPDVGVGALPTSVTVGDFNGDGRPDLAAANFVGFSEPGTVSIRLGQGDGTFQVAPELEVGGQPLSLTVGDFNGDGRPDLATANFFANTVSILINAGVVVSDFVTFDPIPSTSTFLPDPTGCPEGFVGIFSFEARLTNASESSLTDLVVVVTTLTNGNLLHNADGGPGGVGAGLGVPRQDGFTDGRLTPDEFVDVPFTICVTAREPFRLVVDVLGEAE